jgi:hypothetical protein
MIAREKVSIIGEGSRTRASHDREQQQKIDPPDGIIIAPSNNADTKYLDQQRKTG